MIEVKLLDKGTRINIFVNESDTMRDVFYRNNVDYSDGIILIDGTLLVEENLDRAFENLDMHDGETHMILHCVKCWE